MVGQKRTVEVERGGAVCLGKYLEEPGERTTLRAAAAAAAALPLLLPLPPPFGSTSR